MSAKDDNIVIEESAKALLLVLILNIQINNLNNYYYNRVMYKHHDLKLTSQNLVLLK